MCRVDEKRVFNHHPWQGAGLLGGEGVGIEISKPTALKIQVKRLKRGFYAVVWHENDIFSPTEMCNRVRIAKSEQNSSSSPPVSECVLQTTEAFVLFSLLPRCFLLATE